MPGKLLWFLLRVRQFIVLNGLLIVSEQQMICHMTGSAFPDYLQAVITRTYSSPAVLTTQSKRLHFDYIGTLISVIAYHLQRQAAWFHSKPVLVQIWRFIIGLWALPYRTNPLS